MPDMCQASCCDGPFGSDVAKRLSLPDLLDRLADAAFADASRTRREARATATLAQADELKQRAAALTVLAREAVGRAVELRWAGRVGYL